MADGNLLDNSQGCHGMSPAAFLPSAAILAKLITNCICDGGREKCPHFFTAITTMEQALKWALVARV